MRVNLADALRRLLDNSLQMTSLSLSKELASPDLPPDRVRELSDYVDTWVELEGRATAAIAKLSLYLKTCMTKTLLTHPEA